MFKNLSNSKKLTLIAIIIIIIGLYSSYTVYAAKLDKIAPTVPKKLEALSISTSSISLIWEASTDNNSVESYIIYKDGVIIGNPSTNSYSISGLASGVKYKISVTAKDESGNISKSSKILSITTLEEISVIIPELESNQTRIVGYYASWAAYSGFTPDKIDAKRLTHINYAFANISEDLKISIGDPYIDLSNFNKLNSLKEANSNLKTLISVGGWTWSDKFSNVALTESSRNVFADSAVDFIIKHGFDGIDVDWEYPVSGGLASNIKRPVDKQNFTFLLKTLREKLDAQGRIDGKKYLLTIAGATGDVYINNTELDILHQYLDFGNIMTYDIHGDWDPYTDFNAPLFNNSDDSQQYKWSIDAAVNAWLKAGFPAEKLNMGVPFYGYKYNNVDKANNGLYQSFSAGSSISYKDIASNYLNMKGYTKYFHEESKVPWLFNGSTYISYDNEQSIKLKAQYIKSKGLGGAMIWELSQDPERVLLNSLFYELQ